ncbi:twin-arginine translocation signal domain-containing protein [Haloferax volcanii]
MCHCVKVPNRRDFLRFSMAAAGGTSTLL